MTTPASVPWPFASSTITRMATAVSAAARKISPALAGRPSRVADAPMEKTAAAPAAEITDEELVARAQTGDAAAFDLLVVKYSPRLYGLIYNMTSNHEDTNDLMQDVFSKAYRSIGGFKGRSSFYTWLHQIGLNMTINFVKKRGRRYHLSLDDVDSGIQNDKEFLEVTSTGAGDPVRETNLNELQRRINEAMQKLSADHRAVVTMFDVQGMPHAEIAAILGVSEGTVRSRLFYAHRQLQNYLEEFRR